MHKLTWLLAALTLAAITVGACGGDAGNAAPAKKVTPRKQVPPDFMDAKPPDGFDLAAPANIEAGNKLFHGDANCFTCHGPSGKGDGDAGKVLDVKPQNLTDPDVQKQPDNYLFWRIKVGLGTGPTGSAMPGFQGAKSDDQIWQLVAYVRSFKGK